MSQVQKGDYPGHPFRGNQHASGRGGGGGSMLLPPRRTARSEPPREKSADTTRPWTGALPTGTYSKVGEVGARSKQTQRIYQFKNGTERDLAVSRANRNQPSPRPTTRSTPPSSTQNLDFGQGRRAWSAARRKRWEERRASVVDRLREAGITKAAGHVPPAAVRSEAARALEWIRQGHAGDGFTAVGRLRARQLAAGRPLGISTIQRMSSYLARHAVDKQGEGFSPGEDGYPSPGRVAWAAWGGDPARSWVASILDSAVEKGDYPGHPFRGNQYVRVRSGGSITSASQTALVAPGAPGVRPPGIKERNPSGFGGAGFTTGGGRQSARDAGPRTQVARIRNADGSESAVRVVTGQIDAKALKPGDQVLDSGGTVQTVQSVRTRGSSTSVMYAPLTVNRQNVSATTGSTGGSNRPVDRVISMGKPGPARTPKQPNRYQPTAILQAGLVGGINKSVDSPLYAVTKSSEERRFTFGPLYMPGVLDAHREYVEVEELQKALWSYVERTGHDRTIYLQHTDKPAGKWVEAATWPTPIEVTLTIPGVQKAGSSKTRTVTLPAGTTFLGVRWEPWAWELVKNGKLRGYSLGGKARKERVEADLVEAASLSVEKGDKKGHPFRGNQHTGGIGGSLSAALASGQGAELTQENKVALIRQACAEFGLPTGFSEKDERKRNQMLLEMSTEEQATLMGRLSGMSREQAQEYGKTIAQKDAAVKELMARGYTTDRHFAGPDGTYTPDRQAQHRMLIEHLLGQTADVPREGQMQMVGGLPGSGKSYFLSNQGSNHGFTPIEGPQRRSVPVNPDDFKSIIVDRNHPARPPGLMGVDLLGTGIRAQASKLGLTGGKEGGDLAGLVHEESSHLATMFAQGLGARGTNYTWDFAMGSQSGVTKRTNASMAAGGTPTAVAYVRTPVIVSLQQAAFRHTEGQDRVQGWNLTLDRHVPNLSREGTGGRMTAPRVVLDSVSPDGTIRNMGVYDSTRGQFSSATLVTNIPGRGLSTS